MPSLVKQNVTTVASDWHEYIPWGVAFQSERIRIPTLSWSVRRMFTASGELEDALHAFPGSDSQTPGGEVGSVVHDGRPSLFCH